jgi:putative flippase GtrA
LSAGVFHLHYLLGNALGFLAGVSLNYCLSVRWVFSQRSLADRRWEVTLFFVVGGAGLLLNELLMALFAGRLRWKLVFAKAATAALVLVWNFGARKLLLFTAPKNGSCRCAWKENEA